MFEASGLVGFLADSFALGDRWGHTLYASFCLFIDAALLAKFLYNLWEPRWSTQCEYAFFPANWFMTYAQIAKENWDRGVCHKIGKELNTEFDVKMLDTD